MNPCVERHTAPFVCRLIRLVAAFGLMLSTLASAAPGGGIIEGRVLNAVTGDYLMNARVVVAGQTETLTNSYGEYRIANVPVGMTTVQVIYTGMPTQTVEVEVKSGEVVRRDVAFGAGQPGEVVTLDKFTVTDTRETDGRTIAINEQRYSPNLKNVVSTDEFGAVTEGNVGEFAKWLPGVTVDYNAADARTISVRGLPSSTTPVSVDGNRMASAASSSATRVFELEQVSINNISRVEITKVPTPDSPADALGGAINLVSRSAFERSRPVFNYRAYTSVNSTQFSLNKTPGPKREPTRKVTPGMDFTYIRPVSKNFGFAVNGLYSEQFNPQFRSQRQWASAGLSVANVPPDNPYLARWLVQDAPKFTRRYSIGSTIDWRFAPTDVLSLGIQYNNYDANFGGSNIQWDVGSTPTWGATFTQGRTNVGTNTIGTNYRHKYGNTIMPTLTWRHNGRVWQFEAGAAYSRSENHYRDIGDGFWENVQLTQASQTIRFDEINAVRPGTVTNSGAPFSLANYRIRTARSSQNDAVDTIRSARANVTRGFDGKVPLTFKAGFDVRENRRDIRYPQRTWTFVGADGLANSADDTAGAYVDKTWLGTASPFGLPVVQWPDVYALHDLFVSKPNYFSLNQTGASGSIATEANNSQLIVERVSSLYLRADTRLLSNRLWPVAGARYELTDDSGEGVLSDPTAIYRRNPD
ncbi:MAG: TonB-dependent receptor plug domain-containing protein, partial [Opitutaceae bacterium]|nr:TonB-dependent receptor plug domain-containing protein [Opitutaceae bacterium]